MDIGIGIDIDTMTKPEDIAQAIVKSSIGSDALVELVRRLRREADRCEQIFVLFLRGLEISKVWRSISDVGTYEKFLFETRLCRFDRYRQGLRALSIFPAEDVDTVGMTGAKIASMIEDEGDRTRVFSELKEKASTQGYPVSEQLARTVADRVRRHVKRSGSRQDRYKVDIDRLRSENVRLQAESERLQAEVARLSALVRALGGDPAPGARAAERRAKAGERSKTRKGSKAHGSSVAPRYAT